MRGRVVSLCAWDPKRSQQPGRSPWERRVAQSTPVEPRRLTNPVLISPRPGTMSLPRGLTKQSGEWRSYSVWSHGLGDLAASSPAARDALTEPRGRAGWWSGCQDVTRKQKLASPAGLSVYRIWRAIGMGAWAPANGCRRGAPAHSREAASVLHRHS